MIFFHNQGPQLRVIFYIKKEKLVKTELFARKISKGVEQNGTEWEIFSDFSFPPLEDKVNVWMREYCSGKQPVSPLPVDDHLFPKFTREVLKNLRNIPFGHSLHYKAIACQMGNVNASRAVGNACGRNPLPLVIPCHRVLAQGKCLGGFSCGLPIKKILLQHEGILYRT